jgi:hypothetical protein
MGRLELNTREHRHPPDQDLPNVDHANASKQKETPQKLAPIITPTFNPSYWTSHQQHPPTTHYGKRNKSQLPPTQFEQDQHHGPEPTKRKRTLSQITSQLYFNRKHTRRRISTHPPTRNTVST